MDFSLNRNLECLYSFRALMNLATSLISIFVPIYFYQIGFPIEKIILFFLLIAFYFFILNLFIHKIISNFGVKYSILLSIPFTVIYYLGVGYIEIYPFLFFILPLLTSLSEALLWVAYDLYFLKFSKEEFRGRQISYIYVVNIVTSIVGPLVGSLLIFNFGYNIVYFIVAGLALSSVFPLLIAGEFKDKYSFNYKNLLNFLLNRKNLGTNLSFLAYSVEFQIDILLWPVFIIMILKSVVDVGLLTSLTAFVSLIIVLIVGRLTDIKNKNYLIKIGSILTSFFWFLRIFVDTRIKIFFVDTFKKFSYNILLIPWEAHTYDIANKKNYLEYFIARQLIFKGGRIIILPLLILVFTLFNIKTAFIISFIISGFISLLYTKIKVN